MPSFLSVVTFIIFAGLIAVVVWEWYGARAHRPWKLLGSVSFIQRYTTDFNSLAELKRIDPVLARDEEIRRLTQILSRREKNNALLVGDAGVGKTAIVEGLAQHIVERTVPEELWNKRIVALDVAKLISGTKYRGEFEERVKKIIDEITASDRALILFVDEAHAILETQGSEGAMSLSDILKPALARGDLQMIGATTGEEYERFFKVDPSFDRRFQAVHVTEPTVKETIFILHGVKDKYREYHKVEFTDQALQHAAELSQQMVRSRKLPDKAIDAMDEAAAMVKVSHIHPGFNSVLFATALVKHPEAGALWGTIQQLDVKISNSYSGEKENYIRLREEAEAKLADLGVVVVDSGDVDEVIREWAS